MKVHLIDINVSAKFHKFPLLPFQDIKEKQSVMEAHTDRCPDVKTVYTPTPTPTPKHGLRGYNQRTTSDPVSLI